MQSYTTCRHPSIKKRGIISNPSAMLSAMHTRLFPKLKARYTVLIYMVGSDLETNYEMASGDIREMMEVGSSWGIHIVLQTGGAKKWGLDFIPSDRKCRWLVQRGHLQLLQETGNANMDMAETLGDFITWGIQQYPAENYVLILWGHGLGPIDGFGGDELHGNHKMKLVTLQNALQRAHQVTQTTFRIIGFDACNMAGLEIVYALRHYAEYLVASVDYTNHNGWDYKTIIESLRQMPALTASKLGEIIVNSYRLHSREHGELQDLQQGVIRLDKAERIVHALEAWSQVLLERIASEDSFDLMRHDRTRCEDYAEETDMVDLVDLSGHFGRSFGCMQETHTIQEAIEDAVIYHMKTPEHPKAKGISIYFPKQDQERFIEKSMIYQHHDFSVSYKKLIDLYSLIMIKKDYNGIYHHMK
ncbi:clostripain-related cysteine peptidase [Paenibacillus glucanolyticus]|uniref:clostripain-related cysteine peptidase n=1 Tax=Paenibacillus glucanolyticus TaxID=59843 RepID=UPI00096FD13B|nr:clostripain-related cysteine peptidase [Paenibacillus glucanolyticus]OMF77097.1 hypothetical protein BK142_13400 [Paenibacillus glucanolyticus]